MICDLLSVGVKKTHGVYTKLRVVLLSQSVTVEKCITSICLSLDLSYHFKKVAIIIAKDKKGIFAHISSQVLSAVSVYLAVHLLGNSKQKAKLTTLPQVSHCEYRDLHKAYAQVLALLDQVLESKVVK